MLPAVTHSAVTHSAVTHPAGLREHQLKELAYAVFLSCCGKPPSRGLLASLRCALGVLWLGRRCCGLQGAKLLPPCCCRRRCAAGHASL